MGMMTNHKVQLSTLGLLTITNPRRNILRDLVLLVALPGETFEIKEDKLYVMKDGQFENIPYTFKIVQKDGLYPKDTAKPITLKDNEYWVLGDNRPASRDCASIGTPITYQNIYGVLVAIEGKGKLYSLGIQKADEGHLHHISKRPDPRRMPDGVQVDR